MGLSDIDLGVLDPQPGDHICGFYRGVHGRDQVLVPFMQAGLLAGAKCVCLLDSGHASTAAAIGTADDRAVVGDQVEVRDATGTYLPDGRFSADRMIAFLDDLMLEVFADGQFPGMRAAGDMSWVLAQPPGADELLHYESEINRFTARYSQVLLCLYDLERFSDSTMTEVIKTHPKMLFGGMVVENPTYLPPHRIGARADRKFGD